VTEPCAEHFFGIEVTRRCNLRCPHCFTASGGQAHAGPPREFIETLLTDLGASGIRAVAFSGGEPLLRPDLAGLIRHGRAANIEHFGLVTNGFLATPIRAHELAAAGLSNVQVSLDGVDAADHCAVRGCEPRDFYRALRAIRAFLDEGIRVDVACLLSPKNLRRAPEMAMFCEALGVRGLRYCSFVPTGRGADPAVAEALALGAEQVDWFLGFMRHLNRQPGGRLELFIDHGIGPWLESGEFECGSGKHVAYLSAEGDLYPCPTLLYPPFRVGSVLTTPVRELLAAPAMAAVRCLRRCEIRGCCATCANQACSGGCRGGAFAATGDVRGPVSYCNFVRRSRVQPECVDRGSEPRPPTPA
jgi:radical SAM protein with 4Fe4S-binding SPASM domain